MAAIISAVIPASKADNELFEKRAKITERLFGKPEEHIPKLKNIK